MSVSWEMILKKPAFSGGLITLKTEDQIREQLLSALTDITTLYQNHPELLSDINVDIIAVDKGALATIGFNALKIKDFFHSKEIYRAHIDAIPTKNNALPLAEYIDKSFAVIDQCIRDKINSLADDNPPASLLDRREEAREENRKDFQRLIANLIVLEDKAQHSAQSATASEKAAQEAEKIAEAAKVAAESAKAVAESVQKKAQDAMTAAEKAQQTADSSKTEAVNAKSEAERAKSSAEIASKAAENVIPNMLTTLGVFVAIIIAVVAVYLSVLIVGQQGFINIQNPGIYLLMGHILINIIFLFLYLIGKMTNRSVSVICQLSDSQSCHKCSHRSKCKMLNKLWLKYPYMILLNGMFFLGYIVAGLWSLTGNYIKQELIELLDANPGLINAVYIIAILVIPFVCYKLWLRLQDTTQMNTAEITQSQAEQAVPDPEPPEETLPEESKPPLAGVSAETSTDSEAGTMNPE